MIPSGHVIASEQINVTSKSVNLNRFIAQSESEPGMIKLNEKENSFISNDIQVEVSEITGLIKTIKLHGRNIILSDLKPNFWRAATDNDLGYNMDSKLRIWKFATDSMVLNSIQFDQNNLSIQSIIELPTINTRLTMTYQIRAPKLLQVNAKFEFNDTTLPMIPRIGFTTALPIDYQNLEWYGRGPHENYWDRKTSAFLSLYSSLVKDQYFPYVRVQETGYKTDNRWMSLSNAQHKMSIMGYPTFQFSALNYRNESLYYIPRTNRHGLLLPEDDVVSINIDFQQMGVGGDTSWGNRAMPNPKYRLHPKPVNFTFFIQLEAQN